MDTSLAAHPTSGRVPRVAEPERKCPHCTTAVPRVSEAFLCGFCRKYYHEHCAIPTAPTTVWNAIRKSSKYSFWACDKCRSAIDKNKKAMSLTTIEGQIEAQVSEVKVLLEKSGMEKNSINAKYEKLLSNFQDLQRKFDVAQEQNDFGTQSGVELLGEIVDLKEAVAVKNDEINLMKSETNKLNERIALLTTVQLENETLKLSLADAKAKFTKLKEARPDQDMIKLIDKQDEFKSSITKVIIKSLEQFENSVKAVGVAITKMNDTNIENSQAMSESFASLEKLVQDHRVTVPKAQVVYPQPIVKEVSPFTKLSYAQALAQAPVQPEAVRTLHVLGDDETSKRVVAQFKTDDCVSEYPILSMKPRGDRDFVLRFQDATTADTVEKQLMTKYKDAITITKTIQRLPRIKLIRVPTGTNDKDEIQEQLKLQNRFLNNEKFKILDVYNVQSPKGTYSNIIFECDIETHTRVIERRMVMYNLGEVRAFEHVVTLQCSKCLAFGHFARSCRRGVHCRKCAKEHATSECDNPDATSCVNCIHSNGAGTNYDTNHRSSDSRCPVRIIRIDALKEYHTKNI